jgi:hypothetical protein
MRYAAVLAVFAVFMIFFGPSLMAWGRNLARQQKEAWREQEQTFEEDDDPNGELDFDSAPDEAGEHNGDVPPSADTTTTKSIDGD